MKSYTVIADSGSSKTDWVIMDKFGNVAERVRTIGFNPYFHTTDFISKSIAPAFARLPISTTDVGTVHYYGAGCSSVKMDRIVKMALDREFSNATVYVDHDLVGAARACLGNNDGIACIIGTGSNSCVWEGGKVRHNIPSHGYIFGDEGSGAYLGIRLVKLYLEDRLDPAIRESFEAKYKLGKDQILNRTYREKNPNVFLAKFAPFFDEHRNDPVIREVIRQGFEDFFRVRILPYPNYQKYDLGFIGSIAYHNQDILGEVAEKYHMRIRKVSVAPIDELVDYHVREMNVKTT